VSNHKGCPVCAARTLPARHGGFSFLECESCGYGLLANVVAKADTYWAPDAASRDVDDFWIGAKRRYFESALALLSEKGGAGRLLDIGGGVGFFAELALEKGWDAYSLDVSPAATALAARRVGPGRAITTITDAAAGSFDVVTLWCVIAHTDDPLGLTALARRALGSTGLVWITTPNFTFQKPYSTMRAAIGKGIDFVGHDHIGHFTARAVTTLLVRCGFTEPSFHYCGITEHCSVSASRNQTVLALKRGWNRAAYSVARYGLPNWMSELQVLATVSST
jgi:SAM-dependent methyltransferase